MLKLQAKLLSNVPQVFRSSTTQLRQLKRASKRNFEMKVFTYWPISAHMKGLICCTKEKNSTSISVVGSEKAFEFKNTTSNRFPRLQLRVPSVRTPAASEVCLDGKVSLLRKNCCQRLTKEPTPFASFFSGRLFTELYRNQFSSFFLKQQGLPV